MDIASNRFLENFSPEGRQCLMACVVVEDYADGSFLFNEGDPAQNVFLVIDGEVEIVKISGTHEEVLSCFQSGDYFGEIGVLDGYGRSTSARARGRITIGKIPREPLLAVLDTEPVSVTLGLFQNVLLHIRRTNDLYMSELVHKEKLSLVGEMASALMHDLRNPVTSIRMAADLVGMHHSDDETSHCCDGIRLQCDRLVDMATELLEFSRGETKLHLARTTTTAFLNQFKALNEEYFRRVTVQFSIDARPAEIEIDSMRFFRVVQNLVTNAVEAIGSREGGLVQVLASVDNGTLTLSVSDNGPGIPEEVRGKIFEPFVTFGKKGGTGLGMAIVSNVVTAHGGQITFDTEVGKGTAFLVRIPQYQSLVAVASDPVADA